MKRGSSVLMLIFEVLVVVAISVLSLTVARAYASSTTVQKINTAEDFRMMIDALVAVPGEAVVHYPQNLSQFSIIFSGNAVKVFEKGQDESDWIIRKVVLPKGHSIEGAVDQQQEVCLEKKRTTITLLPCMKGVPG